ncbi:hypothetical protein [Methylobacterium sp. J-070]|uniref:hypothetical protein n=1 Tax=Methylobacterium sp. J-070 TaxID=2836650 RepID=UPI001FBABE7B|nr:hypothetical protein [Methylobacterium sp. J-070]MCJ2054408.1 hypothetical protein [Methylobacterium sp. J-070]
MRCLALSVVLFVATGAALAVPDETPRPARIERTLTDGVFVRPLYGVYRHCGGACLKSGELTWYCFAKQSCSLSCATAPPQMKCATP